MLPIKQGLYDPQNEHDNCGAGFICSLKGKKTNDIIHKALDILCVLEHRGAVSSDGKTGDGAGILIEIPQTIYPTLYDTFVYLFKQAGVKNIEIKKEVDFKKLFNSRKK